MGSAGVSRARLVPFRTMYCCFSLHAITRECLLDVREHLVAAIAVNLPPDGLLERESEVDWGAGAVGDRRRRDGQKVTKAIDQGDFGEWRVREGWPEVVIECD